jgi:hypothetical protein
MHVSDSDSDDDFSKSPSEETKASDPQKGSFRDINPNLSVVSASDESKPALEKIKSSGLPKWAQVEESIFLRESLQPKIKDGDLQAISFAIT